MDHQVRRVKSRALPFERNKIHNMITGEGSLHQKLSDVRVQELVQQGLGTLGGRGDRILVIIPDRTRTAPLPLLFATLCEILGRTAAQMDFLIALGTHPALSEEAIAKLVGMDAGERSLRFPNVGIFNHRWDVAGELITVGVISGNEMEIQSGGLLVDDVPVRLNRRIHNYDQIIICGPVFPHEVAGFSGGNKYLVPGIAGREIIDATHWLGALVTSMKIIGVKNTPVRSLIDLAASMVRTPVVCLALCMKDEDLYGLFIGPASEAWNAAADLSAQFNIIRVPHTYHRVLSVPSRMYTDLWTAGKAMYKTEAVVADGGEIIIYAPHLKMISYTHQTSIEQIGYHVRDYFVKQWDKYAAYPGTVLAHSTHVRGAGAYENGIERPRIQVTLAAGISPEICERVSLGYLDPGLVSLGEWESGKDDTRLLVCEAGEKLYQVG